MLTKIPLRKLGNNQFQVSCQGLGCMGMSEFYGESSNEESIETLNAAFSNGINFFDTADFYGAGENEILIASFLKKHHRTRVPRNLNIFINFRQQNLCA